MSQKDIRVLVVEDVAMVSEMIQGILEDMGYTVAGEAKNGRQAVELTQSLRPDVILMDIEMPDMDGIEAMRRIQESCPAPVAVLTAYETPELIEQVSAAGAGAYLVKPPNAHEMGRAIAIAMARFDDLMTLRRLNDELQTEIAERVRAEEQLRRYAVELEQNNKEIKQFAYIVSHDLRAPLVNLKGFAAELRYAWELIGSAMSTAMPHLDETQQSAVTTALQADVPEALHFIDSSVTRMDRFINALLRLSRLGRRELDLEPIDMNALVQATLQSLAHQIEEHQIKVSVGSLPEVVADRISMEQIMGNILTNAILYLDPARPGEIEVTAERGPSTSSGRGPDETTFHVRDNGRGIAEKDMDRIFAPFRRAGRQDVPGEGMGLAYVQTLARRHGGRIRCESELGVGTTFTLTLSNHL